MISVRTVKRVGPLALAGEAVPYMDEVDDTVLSTRTLGVGPLRRREFVGRLHDAACFWHRVKWNPDRLQVVN